MKLSLKMLTLSGWRTGLWTLFSMGLLVGLSPAYGAPIWQGVALFGFAGGLAFGLQVAAGRREQSVLLAWGAFLAGALVLGLSVGVWSLLVLPQAIVWRPFWTSVALILPILLWGICLFEGWPRLVGPGTGMWLTVVVLVVALGDQAAGTSPEECTDLAEEGVTLIFPRQSWEKQAGVGGMLPYSMVEVSDGLVALCLKDAWEGYLPQWGESEVANALALLDPKTSQLVDLLPLSELWGSSRCEELLWDPASSTLVTYLSNRTSPHALVVYDLKDHHLVERTRRTFEEVEPTGLTFTGTPGEVAVSFNKPVLRSFVLPNLEEGTEVVLPSVSPVDFYRSLAWAPGGILVTSLSGSAVFLPTGDEEKATSVKVFDATTVPTRSNSGEGFWLAGYSLGNIFFLSTKGGELLRVGEGPMPMGDLCEVAPGEVLLATGLKTGELQATCLKGKSSSEIARLGSGARAILLLRDGSVLVGSSCGIWRVSSKKVGGACAGDSSGR